MACNNNTVNNRNLRWRRDSNCQKVSSSLIGSSLDRARVPFRNISVVYGSPSNIIGSSRLSILCELRLGSKNRSSGRQPQDIWMQCELYVLYRVVSPIRTEVNWWLIVAGNDTAVRLCRCPNSLLFIAHFHFSSCYYYLFCASVFSQNSKNHIKFVCVELVQFVRTYIQYSNEIYNLE